MEDEKGIPKETTHGGTGSRDNVDGRKRRHDGTKYERESSEKGGIAEIKRRRSNQTEGHPFIKFRWGVRSCTV
jgi:hypothetical protein